MPDLHAPLPPDGAARRVCGIIYTHGADWEDFGENDDRVLDECGIIYTHGADWEPPPIHAARRGEEDGRTSRRDGILIARVQTILSQSSTSVRNFLLAPPIMSQHSTSVRKRRKRMIRRIFRMLNLASGSIPSRSKRYLIASRPVRDHEMLNPAFGSLPHRELVSSSHLADVLASPCWLIPDVLQRNALIQLFGAPGTGKSLLALDIALCVAAQQQGVVYVAAEAPEEHIPRLAAWEDYYRQSPEHLYFWLHPLELANRSDVAEFVKKVRRRLNPALIIIDPLASCMVGLEESATSDMVKAIEGLNLLRAATGAAILIVHHTGWDVKHERGSSALRAACRVVLKLSANGGGTVNLTSEKMNNGRQFRRSFEIAQIANQRGDSAVVLKTLANHNTGLNWQVIANVPVSASPAASP